jgi:hypothetical protein
MDFKLIEIRLLAQNLQDISGHFSQIVKRFRIVNLKKQRTGFVKIFTASSIRIAVEEKARNSAIILELQTPAYQLF